MLSYALYELIFLSKHMLFSYMGNLMPKDSSKLSLILAFLIVPSVISIYPPGQAKALIASVSKYQTCTAYRDDHYN